MELNSRLMIAAFLFLVLAGLYLLFVASQEHAPWAFRRSPTARVAVSILAGFAAAVIVTWSDGFRKVERVGLAAGMAVALLGAVRFWLAGGPVGMHPAENIASIVAAYFGAKAFFLIVASPP